MNAPKPMVICRSKGSVSGNRFDRSQYILTLSVSTSRINHGCRLCGFGARMALHSAFSLM